MDGWMDGWMTDINIQISRSWDDEKSRQLFRLIKKIGRWKDFGTLDFDLLREKLEIFL